MVGEIEVGFEGLAEGRDYGGEWDNREVVKVGKLK
jgi:hypothetical protein